MVGATGITKRVSGRMRWLDWAIDKHNGTPKANFADLEPGNNPIHSIFCRVTAPSLSSDFRLPTSSIKSPTTVNLLAYFWGILAKTSGFIAANLSIQRYHRAS